MSLRECETVIRHLIEAYENELATTIVIKRRAEIAKYIEALTFVRTIILLLFGRYEINEALMLKLMKEDDKNESKF